MQASVGGRDGSEDLFKTNPRLNQINNTIQVFQSLENPEPEDEDLLPTPPKRHPVQGESCDKILSTKQSIKCGMTELETKKEEVYTIKSEDVERGEPVIDVSVGIVVKAEPIEQNDVDVEENLKPSVEPQPESIEVDELIIKDEIDTFEDELSCFENDLADDDNVDEDTLERVTVDVETKDTVRERERHFKCDLCEKAFYMKWDLERHFSVHPEYQNIECEQCPRRFFHKRDLNRHKKEVHKSKESYFECSICKKLLKNQSSLSQHQEVHDDVEYCCEHCGKKFKSRKRFKGHLKIMHTNRDSRLIPCTVCGKTLAGRDSLRLHMQGHSDQRYKCSFPFCGRIFLRIGYLKSHEKTHTKDYKFKCKFCSFGTTYRKRILLHEQQQHNHNRFSVENNS